MHSFVGHALTSTNFCSNFFWVHMLTSTHRATLVFIRLSEKGSMFSLYKVMTINKQQEKWRNNQVQNEQQKECTYVYTLHWKTSATLPLSRWLGTPNNLIPRGTKSPGDLVQRICGSIQLHEYKWTCWKYLKLFFTVDCVVCYYNSTLNCIQIFLHDLPSCQ